MNKDILDLALSCGFSYVQNLDISTLTPLNDVRDMCAANKCNTYNKNWACPPGCGSIEQCTEKIREYNYGVILQTSGILEDSFDYENIQALSIKHNNNMKKAAQVFRDNFTDCLPLGAGPCTVCEKCAYPNSPCRFPEKSFSSMEAYGLWVSKVCEDNNLKYYYGENTLTYTGCILIK